MFMEIQKKHGKMALKTEYNESKKNGCDAIAVAS